jgi:biopolymer transport protein ExbD
MEEKEFDYINVIPLVDVMLVLLTIVLTTSSFIATGMIPLDLPKVVKSQGEMLRTQTVEIDRQGALFFNARRVSLDDLKGSLGDRDRNLPILIRADRQIALQGFVDVLDLVKKLGFKRVSLQTEERP